MSAKQLPQLSDYLTVAQAASAQGITPGRIWQLLGAGEFPGRIQLAGICLIPTSEVEAFQRRDVGRPKSRNVNGRKVLRKADKT